MLSCPGQSISEENGEAARQKYEDEEENREQRLLAQLPGQNGNSLIHRALKKLICRSRPDSHSLPENPIDKVHSSALDWRRLDHRRLIISAKCVTYIRDLEARQPELECKLVD